MLVALVAGGIVPAIVVLAVVVGVMQLESHVLQPFLLGRAIRLHPLAVVLALATGLVAGGIVGALLAVPLLAVLTSALRSLAATTTGRRRRRPDLSSTAGRTNLGAGNGSRRGFARERREPVARLATAARVGQAEDARPAQSRSLSSASPPRARMIIVAAATGSADAATCPA
ncbi:AI-2E family transporter [Amycolatopsis sp. La24]|uniref:AI-2E family transporter n=1 Tax=Amycolatopsis sp. La24 TaxID=3028304 RepID=UPI0023AEACB6|nr:AI-2E family transporter [Amycolatopsis sp. La24]